MNIAVVRPNQSSPLETFIRAHLDELPGQTSLVEGGIPCIDGRPVKSQAVVARTGRKVWRVLRGHEWDWEVTSCYVAVFRRLRADVVLAEYGPTGVRVLGACRLQRVPLVVHFHGCDASIRGGAAAKGTCSDRCPVSRTAGPAGSPSQFHTFSSPLWYSSQSTGRKTPYFSLSALPCG